MKYIRSEAYATSELMAKIMGPNPIKLEEELLQDHRIPAGAVVCDLGSGQGLTSVFLAKEYGFTVYAADLWSDPEENRRFFREMGLDDRQIIPVHADATALPFEKEFFDAVISTDSYNYFGRDPEYLDQKLLPFVKKGGYLYIAIPGMKRDCHEDLPPELLEQIETGKTQEMKFSYADADAFYIVRGYGEQPAGSSIQILKLVSTDDGIIFDTQLIGSSEKQTTSAYPYIVVKLLCNEQNVVFE